MELILINVVSAAIAAWVASTKGRNIVAWFLLGFFFGPIALVVVVVLPDLRREQRRFDQINNEQRRLREQIRQERMKNESFRQYSSDRLDAHDDALNLDTRSRQSLPAGDEDEIQRVLESDKDTDDPSANAAQPPTAEALDGAWYYEDHGESRGPVEKHNLREMLRDGKIGHETLVWSASLKEWTPARDVEDLRWKDAA